MEKEFIESLEVDGKIILDKLKLALQTEKHSNYKVLINNLRETVNLIYDIKRNGKKDIKIDNLNIDKVSAKNIKGFIDEMYQYTRTGCDTFDDNKDKKHTNILDPTDNSIACINFIKGKTKKYGGHGIVTDGLAIIRFDGVLKDLKKDKYIVTLYPSEECKFEINKHEKYFIVTTDKDINFDYEIVTKNN